MNARVRIALEVILLSGAMAGVAHGQVVNSEWNVGNGNGKIDNDDYTVWRSHFGQTAGAGSGVAANLAVPEPAAMMTCLSMLSTLWYARLRRRAA